MKQKLKIILSVLFVFIIAFAALKIFMPTKHESLKFNLGGLPAKAPKVVYKPYGGEAVSATKAVLPLKTIGAAKMAIILDDWGNNYKLLEEAIAIQRPLTIAILPKLTHSRQIAQKANENNLGIMLHMPMQPKNKEDHLEPHTIMVTSSEKQIIQYLDEALLSVPYLEGVNNHMGSAATSDRRVMTIALKYLKSKKLFFIDSHVIASSVCASVAKEVGIPFGSRQVFIDNELKLTAIQKQLRQAIRVAKTRGEAIVIGHDKYVTLQAIKSMVPEIEKSGVQLVYARELVRK